MHLRTKEPDKAIACLREAMEHWQKQDGAEETLAQVLKIAARIGTQLRDRALVADTYKMYLESVDGSDAEALCGLVKAMASSDPLSAEEYAQRLDLPDYGHLDAEELEMQPIPKVAQLLKERGAAATGEVTVVKPKKKRKPRYPKGFDPNNPGPPPDPERWLPKNQRSSFLKSSKKRDKNLARGPQGAVAPADDLAFRKQGPSTAQIDLSKPDASRPKGNAGKRKGKK
mmetsp:Transcript_18099/g.51558  ORF Transcript_18099/g.51558 Transcript_18099/m.51558 type:complete len:228 (-) Transcript_18099:146-829(-)